MARELKTDKGRIQLKKNDHEKTWSTGTWRKYTHHTSVSQASSGSFPYNNHVTEEFYEMRSELRFSEYVEACSTSMN